MLAAKWLKVELHTCEKELILYSYTVVVFTLKKNLIWYIDIVERYIMIGMFVIMDELI